MFSAPRLSSLLFGCLVLLGGPTTASATAPPGCLNPCIPEACPDTCLGCEATAPTACTPQCEGGAVACDERPEAGLASLASWDAGEVTSPEALDKTGRSCTAVTDLSDTVCVTFCEKVCTGCVEGFVGPNCEFSDATTCSGNGLVRADGSCVCDAGWNGDNCALPVCEPGFVGAECGYSNATTCNDLGFVDFDGTCSCIGNATGMNCEGCLPGTAGPECRYSDLVNCNGQGAVQPDGSCICSGLFAGDFCEQCEPGTAGPSCIFSDAVQCLDRGLALFDGTCSCEPAFTGNNCDLCAPGYAGAGCIFSDETTCGGNGSVQEDGSCVCSGLFTGADCSSCIAGFAGAECQFSDAVVCTGRGAVQEDGSCVCSAAFAGNSCEACAEGLVGPDCAFTDAVTCGGRGAAQFDGSCLCTEAFSGADCSSCAVGFAGPECLFSDAVTCNGNGAAQADGSCLCAENFQGAACDLCADRFAGADCAFSDVVTCNGLGVAQADGSCVCESRYAGDRCERCAFTDYNFPDCPACVADSDCSGNGICTASGSCICDPAFTGSTCSECAFGYASILGAPAVDGSGEGSGAGSGEGSGAGSGADPDAGTDTGSGEGSAAGSGEGSGGAIGAIVACLRCPGAIACNGQDVCVAGTDAAGEPVALCACAPGTYDYDCSRTTADCSEHGQPVNGGGCNCDAGFGGVRCEIERASVCSINGTPQEDGSCICSAGWVGDLCDSRCGNGEIGEGEGCDDGNGLAGDGCNARCLVEPGYNCGTEMPSQCILDLDADGVADEEDNCVTEPNTDQADGNTNGSGDACDPFEPIVEADAGSGEGSGDAFGDGTLERDTEGSGDTTSTPPTDEPPAAASCSATGNSAAGWLSMVLVMGAASLLRRRRGAALGLALVVALSGCAAEEQAAIEEGAAIPDTGSTPERELGGDVSGAPKDPPATDDAGAADADLGTLDVSGGTRRAGDLEFRDYRICEDNLDCPNGMGSCLKEVKLNRKAGGVEVVAVRDMPGFSQVPVDSGICSLGCTDHAELCESLRYGDDTTPWSCQLTYKGTSPYQLPAGGLPFTPSQEELTAGVAYAAVCRPPFARSKYLARDFCDVCTSSDSCWPGSACVETAPNSDAPPAEKQGMCLAACTVGAANTCPMGFNCRELGTTERQLGVGRAGGFCVPAVGDCDACLDRDGDGVGTGSCTSQGTSSAVDCDDADSDTYFDAIDPDHAFPGSCGPQLDANCNGKGDAADQIGRQVEGGDELVYGAEHCGGCGITCGGSEGSGLGTATRSCKKTKTGTTDSYACTPDCDNETTNADCTSVPGCETSVTDPSRLLVRDCDGDGHGDAGSTTLAFACDSLRRLDFESASALSQFSLPGPAWSLSPIAAHQGAFGLRSGAILGNGLTEAYYSAVVDAGTTLRFWWRSSSQPGNDLWVWVNDELVVRNGGESGWQEYVGSIAPGTLTIHFLYTQRVWVPYGVNAVFIDDLQLVPPAVLMADRNGVERCPGVPLVSWQGHYGDDCDDLQSSVYYAAPLSLPTGQTAQTFNTTPREVCDGRDNDCDGGGDQGVFGVGARCTLTGNPSVYGECRTGINACSAGQALPVCVPSVGTDEVCDGLDNDCDGAVDDMQNGDVVSRAGLAPVVLGEACANPDTTVQGVCAMGVWRCSGGGAACVVPSPTTDSFGDDVDQDCDGIDGVLASALFVRNGGATTPIVAPVAETFGFEVPADAPRFVGTTAPWAVATGAGRTVGNALKSGAFGNLSTSSTTLTVTLGAPGELRFWVKTSSEANWDVFRFAINGVLDTTSYSGVTGWTEVVRALPTGRSTIEFRYVKDGGEFGGLDAVWIDDVSVRAPGSTVLGTRENPVGNMAAALDLVRARGTTNPIRQIHVAGSSDPYPMPYGLRLNGAADTNFAIVGGYDVNFPARGGAVWIPGTGATRLVFSNPCGQNQAVCPGTEALAGYAHVEPAIEVTDPRQVIFRKVTIEVPTPPVGFGAVGGVSCKVSNALLGTCSGLTLDRVSIKMQGGAPGQVGVAGASYTRAGASSTVAFTASGGRGALGCRGSGSGGAGGKGNSVIAQRRGGSASNDAARGGGFGGLVSTDSAAMAGKRGFTPSDTFWAASGGFRAQRTLPLSVFSNGAGANGPAGGGGGGGAGWEVFGGGGGAGGGCGGGGGTPGAPGGSVFGLISTSVVDLPTTVMTSIQMGPGGSGGFGGDGGIGQQGGSAAEGPTPFEKPALTSDADWTASRGNAAFIPPGGPGGSGGGGGGGAGGSAGWSVGVAKPASLAIPLSLGVSIATNTGIAGMGGSGGGGGPSIGLDLPPAPAVGSAGVSGLPGGSISSCVLFTEGAAGDVACGLSSKRSLGSFCQADSECVDNNCASGAAGSSNDRCAPPGMAYIPAGSFAMGRYFAPGVTPVPAAQPSEAYHQVEITRPFFLGRKEFTTTTDWAGLTPAIPGQYRWTDVMVTANGRSLAEGLTQCYTSGQFSADGLDCDGYRLPTAAEFEYALRAETRDESYWGPFTDPIRRDYEILNNSPLAATGSRLPNPWGLYDMAGNVPEWTQDEYYEQSPPAVFDPGVFGSGRKNVAGAGLFNYLPSGRYSLTESDSAGFRLARTVKPRVEGGTCPLGFHVEATPTGAQCRSDVSVCTVANGKGRQLYGRGESCKASVCDPGYTVVGNACLALLGTACSSNAECAEGRCATTPTGTENDRCAPAGMVFAPGGVHAYANNPVTFGLISRGFFIAETETTQLEWKQFANGANPSDARAKFDEAPVNQVDWYAAAAYANARSAREGLSLCYDLTSCTDAATGWFDGDYVGCASVPLVSLSCTGYRLPTATEWLYASQAATRTPLVSNDSTAWAGTTAPRAVAGKTPNALGLYDMSGNVWELMEDPAFSAPGSTSTSDVLVSTTNGTPSIFLSGGSVADSYSYGLTVPGPWSNRTERQYNIGFRLARSVVAPVAGAFCAAGFHQEGSVCESDLRTCMLMPASGTKGRQRWLGSSWSTSCESVCAAGQMQHNGSCYSVPAPSTTCSTLAAAGPSTTAAAFGFYTRLNAQTSINSTTLVATDPVGGYRSNRFSDRYAVSLTAGQRVDIYLDGSPFDAWVQVYGGSSCGLLAENDDQSSSIRNAGLGFVAPTTGTYYVVATSYREFETGNYTLYIAKR